MKKSTMCGLLALICIIAPFALITLGVALRTSVYIGIALSVVALIISIVGIVVSKKEKSSKGFAVLTLILSIISTIAFLLGLAMGAVIKDSSKTQDLCKTLVNCKYIGNDESICYMDGDSKKIIGVYCANSVLNEDQYE